MSLTAKASFAPGAPAARAGRLALLAATLLACGGGHYEGGGRRGDLPTASQAMTPNIGPGDATSTNAGAAPSDIGAAGAPAPSGGGTYP